MDIEMRLIVLLLVVAASATAMNLKKITDPCHRVECRAGRECLVSGGVAQCLCVTSCPDHDKPVCGSDGKSYDNYCLLHQWACVSGTHISVDYKGYCQRDIELAMKEFGMTTRRPTTTSTTTTTTTTTLAPLPAEEDLSVCYGPQRDALRDVIISHWQANVKQQPWYTENMTYRESLSGHFFSCDTNRDYKLRPDELIECFASMPFLPRPEQDLTITRTLCTDALIESADVNKDWRLDFQEFTHLLDPLYHLEDKNCSLEGKEYTDGAEVRVECNHCVCATGSWVCATHNCPAVETTTKKAAKEDKAFGYMDNKYDLDDDKKNLDDSDEYYDEDDYDDDDFDDREEKLDDFKKDEAKKEYKLLSLSDQEKLTKLESNIKKFYSDMKKTSNATKPVVASLDIDDSEESDDSLEETSSEEEEDDLLDQYDELLEKSKAVKEKLNSLRTSIRHIEDERTARYQEQAASNRNNDHHHDEEYHPNSIHHDAYPTNSVVHNQHNYNDAPSSNSPHHVDVHLNSIQHGKTQAHNKKQQKYDAYRSAMRAKLERHRQASQTDNDIWEDQWKAKVKKQQHPTASATLHRHL